MNHWKAQAVCDALLVVSLAIWLAAVVFTIDEAADDLVRLLVQIAREPKP